MDELYDKIIKLLSKAESAKTLDSLAEAEAFTQKAQELMMKHDISISKLESSGAKKKSSIHESDTIQYGQIKSDGDYEISLATLICDHNSCMLVYNRFHKTMWVIGRMDVTPTVVFMISVVRDTIRRASRASYIDLNCKMKSLICIPDDTRLLSGEKDKSRPAAKAYAAELLNQLALVSADAGIIGYNWRSIEAEHVAHDSSAMTYTISRPELFGMVPYREVYIRSFLKGAVEGISDKLEELRRREYKGGYGLVLADRMKDVNDYVETSMKVKTVKEKKKEVHAAAYRAGKKAGSNVTFNAGIESDQSGNIKQLNN
ncbi:DUF2786 domain-containing protein [Candidatus Nomurabacteria bacterium]|nr:DUF2786 domain-containing protein [Candidatus Nomurabacteria bacterium]